LLSFDRVLGRLETRSPRALPHAPDFPGARPSAVLVALADGPLGPEVLLTRRAMHLRNHRGEISFPGGRLEVDEDAVSGALREAFEEVLLPPDEVEVVAELGHLSTVVSRSYIVPIVGRLRSRPVLVPNPHEVDRLLYVPLAELVRSDTYREERWGTPPLDRSIHFFELDDETIWGATGRILHDLLCLVTA
jgi:8-oxo-dGTP pyrophosphatase MutT (NUDIX family)